MNKYGEWFVVVVLAAVLCVCVAIVLEVNLEVIQLRQQQCDHGTPIQMDSAKCRVR